MTIWHDTCFTDAQRHNVTALYVTFRRHCRAGPENPLARAVLMTWRAGRSGEGTQMESHDQVIAELRSAGGAILCWQVSDGHAFRAALAHGMIAFDADLDLYHLPDADLTAERAALDDETGAA